MWLSSGVSLDSIMLLLLLLHSHARLAELLETCIDVFELHVSENERE